MLEAADLDIASIIEAAQAGDPVALPLIERAGHDLGVALANLLNLLNPGAVVLGGTLLQAGDILLAPLREAMRARALSTSLENTVVQTSSLGKDAVALGAATLVLQNTLTQPWTLDTQAHRRQSHQAS